MRWDAVGRFRKELRDEIESGKERWDAPVANDLLLQCSCCSVRIVTRPGAQLECLAHFNGSPEEPELVTNQNHHLLRRPGVGISEAAGTLQAGANTLQNIKDLKVEAVAALLLDGEVSQALSTLNTMDTSTTRDDASIADAIGTLQKAVGKSKKLEEAAIKMTIVASRLYLLGVHLLPLRAGLTDPEWWAEQIPQSLLTNRKFQAWKASPSDKFKMQRALAALITEKIEESSGAGANDAAALFGRSLDAAADEGSSDSSAKAVKNKKKEKKNKKKSTSSSGTSADKKAEKAKKAKKEKKSKKGKEPKSKAPKKRSSSADCSSSPSKASTETEKKPKRKTKAESVSSSPEVRRVSSMTPDGRIIVKEEDRYDEVDVKSAEWTLKDLLEELLTVYAAPIAGAGGPDSAESPRSVDSEGPFTRGFPDPTSIEEQKQAYCRSLDHQLEEGNKSLQQQNIERKKQLHEAAEQQKQALLLHMEQQVKMQEMALDEQTNHALMGLKKAALDQRAALEQQAASLTLEYQQRKMQEEFAATQAEMQRQYVDSATKLHSEVQKTQYESKSKMQREWERQVKERHEVLGPASMNMPPPMIPQAPAPGTMVPVGSMRQVPMAAMPMPVRTVVPSSPSYSSCSVPVQTRPPQVASFRYA
eukprot:s2255_g3.t1